jgi:cytoskeletal protein CcmA (bactofilin family)
MVVIAKERHMSAHSNGIRLFGGRLVEASVIVLLAASNAVAQARASTTGPLHPATENYYAAGDRIEVTVPIGGDVIVAGRHVEITETVSGDVLAAGWLVSFTGRTPDDVRVAGADVKLDGVITGDLTAAGGALVTGPRTHVTGRTWLTGQSVRVEGRFERELRIAGQTVQLAGEMAQPVTVIAEKLEVLPSARIQGPLNYKSPTEASIAPAAACQRNAWRRCAMRRDKARCSEAPCW